MLHAFNTRLLNKRLTDFLWLYRLRLLVGLLALMLCPLVYAYNTNGTDNGFVSKEYLRDPSGEMRLEDAQQSKGWKLFRGHLALGFTDDAVWIRATPIHSQISPEKAVARIGAPYLDDVQIYKPDAQGHYTVKRAGDKLAFSEREIAVNNFAFPLVVSASGQQPWPVYARVRSSSSMLVTFELLDTREFQQMWDFELLLFGFVAGFVLLLSVFALIQGLVFKDVVALAFAAYQLSAFCMAIGISGIAAIFIFNTHNHAHVFTSYAVFFNVLGGLFFYRMLLREMGVGRWSNPITAAGALICSSAMLLFFGGFERQGLELNIYLVILILITLIPMFLWGLRQTFHRITWTMAFIYGLSTLSVLAMVLPLTGFFDFGRFTPYYAVLNSFILTFAFASTLIHRRLLDLQKSVRLQFKFQQSLHDNETIRSDRDEKERFLAMLVHELRTPLSVIRLVIDSFKTEKLSDPLTRRVDHASQAVLDINQVIERTVLADQVERGDTAVQQVVCNLPELANLALSEHERTQRVATSVQGHIPQLKSDPILIKTVLSNLVDNAIKYSPATTPISMTISEVTREQRQGVLVVVRNQPSQAGKPDPQRVFQKYYRSTGARRSSGSGLGLYLVAGLAQSLGGEVRYRTDLEPEDVVFEFWLPV